MNWFMLLFICVLCAVCLVQLYINVKIEKAKTEGCATMYKLKFYIPTLVKFKEINPEQQINAFTPFMFCQIINNTPIGNEYLYTISVFHLAIGFKVYPTVIFK